MKKLILIFIIQYISQSVLTAQVPDWSVKESDYQYTMTFLAKLNVNGTQLVGSDDRVAAFVGTTCRGISGLTYVSSRNTFYAYLTVFSNTQDETIYFKLYDSKSNTIHDVSKPVTFKVNEHKGDLFQSYSIAEPALNDRAEILTFNFKDVTGGSTLIRNGAVTVSLDEKYNLSALRPVFTLSKGAKLFKNSIQKNSESFTDDFSTDITYEVLSEDESKLTSYTISVSQFKSPTLFYKKDAVCYAGGAIKVVSSQEGSTVNLTSDGVIKASRKISNGEAFFTDLQSNTYVVTIGEEFKIINILLKTE